MKPVRSWKPYWPLQAIGWTLLVSFYFGTRLSLLHGTVELLQGLSRFGLTFLATFPLRAACRAVWRMKAHFVLGVFSCFFLAGLLALAGELAVERFGRIVWNTPPTIEVRMVIAESIHFFITLSCWCALYFTAKAYLQAEEQDRETAASLLVQRDAELERLRYQIQPDFFSVGLDRISSLIQDGNPNQASVMISQFGGLLQSMLEEREIPLGDLASELVHLRDYLKIVLDQRDFPLEVDLGCDLEPDQILIPRWLLIPLAEATLNNIKASSRIRISSPAHDLLIQLCVPGGAMQGDWDFAGIHTRLREIFGECASLTSTIRDQDLDVRIRMPLVSAIDALASVATR